MLKIIWNQWKIFDKMTEDRNCDLIWGSKWPGNWAFEANIQHTFKLVKTDMLTKTCATPVDNFF